MIIDGTTEPNFAGSPLIEINGANAGGLNKGFSLSAGSDGSTICGLMINDFAGEAVSIVSNNDTVEGCYIGIDSTGTLAVGNNWNSDEIGAISISGNNNTIGGTTAADRNVISGNTHHGVYISGNNNNVLGNYIGLNAAGTAQLANSQSGVYIAALASGNIIGGTVQGYAQRHLGQCEQQRPWFMEQITSWKATTSASMPPGTATIGNGWEGIDIYGQSNTVGGATATARNVISGNGRAGIWTWAGRITAL